MVVVCGGACMGAKARARARARARECENECENECNNACECEHASVRNSAGENDRGGGDATHAREQAGEMERRWGGALASSHNHERKTNKKPTSIVPQPTRR